MNQPKRKGIIAAILITGLIAGTLDITAATVQYMIMGGKAPEKILYYIASGVFGKEGLAGGTMMAFMGLLFHYCIAYGLTIFYFLIYPKISFLGKNRILAAILYGIFAWLVTNLIIVPLSNTPKPQHFDPARVTIAVLILIVMIGLPISFLTSRYYNSLTKRS